METRYDPPDDQELVTATLSGDRQAFGALFERHSANLHRLARSVLRDESDAEEAVQEAFLRAYCALDRFEGRSRFSTWLRTITWNACLMHLRTRRRRPAIASDPTDLDQHTHGTDSTALPASSRPPDPGAIELKRRIEAAVEGLDDIYRDVFLARDVEGLSIHETSELLALSIAATKTRLHRARRQLRAELGPYVSAA